MRSLKLVILVLEDLHELLEISVLKVLELLLVVGGLVKISLADAVHDADALLESLQRILEVGGEVVVGLVRLDLSEALDLEIGSFEVQPDVDDLLFISLQGQINPGCRAEGA